MLEIRMPGAFHEIVNRVLAAIVLVLAEELGLEFNNLGSTRFDSSEFAKGIEPNSCFFIQNAQAAQGLDGEISSNVPPDLAVEVDIAHRSQSKLPIYSAIAVPELWLYRQDALSILALQGGEYQEISTSLAFPAVSVAQLNQWLQLRKTGTDLTAVRAVREFCRDRSTSP
ncbi:Uma2 family endonuclease [Geitlerinema sp. CS-897]|nr:Uma2 family endonuclease [Geitlerinema sp. CS-897]